MVPHLRYNPARDPVEYLQAINCGENRVEILDQLLTALRGEIGRPNHQHHLLIGPRGSGKTHLLRILTAGRIPADPALSAAYLPVVMPEETPLRSPGDLFLKFVERLAEQLKNPPEGIAPDAARTARGTCLAALTTAKGMKDPLERLELMAGALESAARTLDRIVLPIAENMDQTFYLGAQRSRKGPLDEQWAIRRHLQESPRLLVIGAAPTLFGAVGDPGKPFYDFFRTHHLDELSNDEVLEIIRLRLSYEAANPEPDELRAARVRCLLDDFAENSPQLRGLVVITGGLPRFIHLVYEVIVETDVSLILDTLNSFLDDMTPYFQSRLDPRFIPQPEIDILHTLALARGPLQPSELAEELYGVSTNEVSELLGRLHERGMVKRAGRPGGQAVTWDLTEPLYRVWTQFRDNSDAQDLYRMLGRFVALLFTRSEIETERTRLAEALACLPDSSATRRGMQERDRMLEQAVQFQSEKQAATVGMTAEAMAASPAVEKARELFNAGFDAGEAGDQNQARVLLEELRTLHQTDPDDAAVRERLAKGLFNAFNDARKAGDQNQAQVLLEELRTLHQTYPDDAAVRERLAKGLFHAFNDARKVGDSERVRVLITELLDLANRYTEESVQEAAQRAVLTHGVSLLALMRSGDGDRGKEGMRQIEAQMSGSLAGFARPLRLAMDVLEKGEEQALAREPEEVRRVVRMLIEEVG